MKNLVIAVLVLAAASWANAATLWTAGFEDGEINLGSAALATPAGPLNSTPYPAAQPTPITDPSYGWASKAYNVTAPTLSYTKIVDTTAFGGANSVMAMNRVLRTDIPVTIAANSIYTFTVHYMDDASTLYDSVNGLQQRIFFRDMTILTTLADNHPETPTIFNTWVPSGVWQTATVSWNSTGSARVGFTDVFRLSSQFGNAFDLVNGGGAYVDDMSFSVATIPEPATLSLLGLGSLLLIIRRRA